MEQIFENISTGIFVLAVKSNWLLQLEMINSIGKQMLKAEFNSAGLGFFSSKYAFDSDLGGNDNQSVDIQECLPNYIANRISSYVQICLERQERVSYEEKIIKSNETRTLLIELSPIWNDADRNICSKVVGSCQDITRQKQLEEVNIATLKTIHHLLNEANDGVIVLDREGVIRFVNPAAESLFARKAEELIGQTFGLPVVTGGRAEVDIIRRGGERALAEMRILKAQDEDETDYIVANLRDISNLKQTETSLKLRERAIAASNNGIVITDPTQPHHPVIYINPAFEKITGYPEAEVIGRNCRFLQGSDRNQPGLVELRKAIHEERECRIILKNYRKDGKLFWNELHVAPVRDEGGNLTNFIGIQTDITDRVQAEEETRESEERLSTVLAAVKEGITFSDEFGRFEVFNREMEQLTGYTIDEANACNDFSAVLYPDPAEQELALHRLEQLKTQNNTIESEVVIDTKSQIRKNILVSTSVVRYRGRQMFLSAYRDITERKQAEEKLKQQRDREQLLNASALRIRQFLDLPQILQVTVDEVRNFLQCDRVVIYQFQPNWSGNFVVESVIKDYIKVLGANVYDPCFAKDFVSSYQAGRIHVINDVYSANIDPCHANLLTQFQVRANLVVPIICTNKLWGLLITHQCSEARNWQDYEIDLLRQLADQAAIAIKQAELFQQIQDLNSHLESQVEDRTAQLKHSQQELQEYINAMTTFNSKIGLDGKILTINKVAQKTSGLDLEKLVGINFWDAPWWSYDQEVQVRVHQAVELAATGETISYEEQARIGDQDFIVTNLGLLPVRNDSGEVKYLIAEAHDITDLKRAEEFLRKALEKEQELGELKSRFVSMASHEFRTPLATIQAASDLLKLYSHKMSEQKKLERIEKIQNEVRNMTELLEDVLTIGKVEAGKLQLKPTNVDVEEFCRNLIEEISLSVDKKHSLVFSSNKTDRVMNVDTKLMRQILTNLVSNAIKYSPQGGLISIELICLPSHLILKIQDRGIGIPLNEQQSIFDSFYRAQNVGNISGTGLGLAITKASVELHGGNIEVSSEANFGTTFMVTIPNLQSS